jgi:alkanesulfonate monooxygenase SsuD/methylene tetrahydromethanopterin reductase-like flavin-dependent oxidoreductase (luciferase family)
VDPAKVRTLDHKGHYFQVRGPLNIERPVHGHPLIIQAGGSQPGQELSARTADIVFSVVNGDTAEAKAAYGGLKARLAKHGRAPGDMASCRVSCRSSDGPMPRPRHSSTACKAGFPRPMR